ncbi:hypothetical protein W822_19085 [Advenella kashmirensis W13003]|uniref:DUF1634 domain-containing protein n=1 Tax=Advenella kashmirensis W13003 TaxID=1424334 RepID=V8QPW0_9BURK|nr:DUF1634 domain-containing protein [Advenella kashmirensis]ETF01355.1 hypothetical protein W822_19085 [Advenella kashmirensis W13003]
MNSSINAPDRHDGLIAALLWYGTLLASAVIGAGILLAAADALDPALGMGAIGYGLIKIGVVIFILLPVSRVMLMMILFLQARDYVYMAIAALVLAIIGTGVLIGL